MVRSFMEMIGLNENYYYIAAVAVSVLALIACITIFSGLIAVLNKIFR